MGFVKEFVNELRAELDEAELSGRVSHQGVLWYQFGFAAAGAAVLGGGLGLVGKGAGLLEDVASEYFIAFAAWGVIGFALLAMVMKVQNTN